MGVQERISTSNQESFKHYDKMGPYNLTRANSGVLRVLNQESFKFTNLVRCVLGERLSCFALSYFGLPA